MKSGFSKLTLACAALAILTTANAGLASDLRVDAPSPAIAVTAKSGQDSVAEGAKNFIASMGDRGINVLGNQSMSAKACREKTPKSPASASVRRPHWSARKAATAS